MARPRYVLSVYASPPGTLSLSPLRHDHNASLWRIDDRRIRLQRYWEFERLSGIKHHSAPIHDPAGLRAFVSALLEQEGLTLADMAAVWGTPGIATEAIPITAEAAQDLPIHSLAHLFSAIAMDTELLRSGTILGLAVDGGPDLVEETRTISHFYAGCVVRSGEIDYFAVESPAPLWSQCRRRYGREEGTLMALETASECRVRADVAGVLGDRTFFGREAFTGTTGPGRGEDAPPVVFVLDRLVRDALASPEGRRDGRFDPRFDFEENAQSAVMKLVQEASYLIMERNIVRALDRYDLDPPSTHLALSGGFALNCPTNSALIDRFGFRGLLAPPCVNDSGQSFGLALLGLHQTGRLGDRVFRTVHAFHGSDRLGLAEALDTYGAFVERVDDLDDARFLDDVENGVVAWVRGNAEIGPRALGHRSLLGDPRRTETKDVLNDVKDRQWWRPVAPIVLDEEVATWFLGGRRSPYMLEVFRVRPELAARVPAVLHLDGTARVQTLDAEADPVLHRLLRAFAARTGIPLLANTSLNDRGEPIVDDAAQALNFCVRKNIGVLYVDDRRIALRPSTTATRPAGPEPRRWEYGDGAPARAALWREWKARGHDVETLFMYAISPRLREEFGAACADRRLDDVVALMLRLNPFERSRVARLVEAYGPDGRTAANGKDVVDLWEIFGE